MTFPYGPQAGCCCKLFRDVYDRATINTPEQLRYQESSGSVAPGDSGWPGGLTWSRTTSAWTISSGELVCSTANKYMRLETNSLSAIDLSPLVYSGHVEWEFDLTFTGSGVVYLGHYTALDFDAGEIRHRDRLSHHLDPEVVSYDWPLVSGQTYRITLRAKAINTDFELLIDGAFVRKSKICATHWGAWGFEGSGTLAIGDMRVDKMYATPCAVDCPPMAPCFFPWSGNTLPAQLLVEIPGEVVTGCADCTTPTKNIDFVGSHLLDLITSGCLAGTSNRCCCYSLTAAFGCYSRLDVAFAGNDDRVDFVWSGSGLPNYGFGWQCANDSNFFEIRHGGYAMQIATANINVFGNCRPTAITLTPVP